MQCHVIQQILKISLFALDVLLTIKIDYPNIIILVLFVKAYTAQSNLYCTINGGLTICILHNYSVQ